MTAPDGDIAAGPESAIIADASAATAQPSRKKDVLTVRPFAEFLAHEYPPVEPIVDPWLPRRGLAMVAGPRGIGKTHFATALAFAIATGGEFLGFKVPEPRKVLYVDGEMDPAEFQSRLRALKAAAERYDNGNPALADKNLTILTHADQEIGIPDLASPLGDGQRRVEKALGKREVLVIDNLSATCRSGVENEAESWQPMQDWLISLRRQGKTVILVHHTGKPDKEGHVSQRGTSRREDVLNTSILLKRSSGSGDIRVEFTKTRGCPAPAPFVAHLAINPEEIRLVRAVAGELENRIAELKAQGLTQKQIAEKLDISEATVSRRKPRDGVAPVPVAEAAPFLEEELADPSEDFTETAQ